MSLVGRVLILFSFFFWLFCCVSMYGTSVDKELTGFVGDYISSSMISSIGTGSYIILSMILVLFTLNVFATSAKVNVRNIVPVIMLTIFLFLTMYQFVLTVSGILNSYFSVGLLFPGSIGMAIDSAYTSAFGRFGALLLTLFIFSITVIFLSEVLYKKSPNFSILGALIKRNVFKTRVTTKANQIKKELPVRTKESQNDCGAYQGLANKNSEPLANKIDFNVENNALAALDFYEQLNHTITEYNEEQIQNIKVNVNDVLDEFDINAEAGEVYKAPSFTRIVLKLNRGEKLSNIVARVDDLAHGLSVKKLRVVKGVGDNSDIVLELPNIKNDDIAFRPLLESSGLDGSESISFVLGLGEDKSPYIIDLQKAPHLLISGSTGSGKSCLIDCMILSLISTYHPSQLRLMLIDCKVVGLGAYEKIPHLLSNVITDLSSAKASLNYLCEEMNDRFNLFSDVSCRNIDEYNKLDSIKNMLQKIVVVIEEFADLTLSKDKELIGYIQSLTQKARAAGIHLVIATQRPSVDVISGVIKSNIPLRISLRLVNKIDSRTILEQSGAEALNGPGDCLVKQPEGNLHRVLCSYVSSSEISRIVAHMECFGHNSRLKF